MGWSTGGEIITNSKEYIDILSAPLYDGFKAFQIALKEEILLFRLLKLRGNNKNKRKLDDFFTYYKNQAFNS